MLSILSGLDSASLYMENRWLYVFVSLNLVACVLYLIGHSGKAPDGVKSLLARIQIGLRSLVLALG